MSKADFILAQPKDLSAADVVKRAAEQGLKISIAHIHTVRSQARTNGRSGKKRSPAVGTTKTRKVVSGNQSEERFLETVLDIGFGRASALLSDFRDACLQHLEH